MPFADRRRRLWQILLLSAGLAVILLIAGLSAYLITVTRSESAWVLHTVEAENQIARVLLDLRRAESSARGYLLTRNGELLREHDEAAARVIPAIDALARLTADNPVQLKSAGDLRSAAEARLHELKSVVDLARQNDFAAALAQVRSGGPVATMTAVHQASDAMLKEEQRLFAARTETSERSRLLASTLTATGAASLVLFAALSIYLVRQSSRARDRAETRLRDAYVNLEAVVETRTTDLREANEEIQRFAYIVSHDLRSPLVNIMGFTSELEELGGDIFGRIAQLAPRAAPPTLPPSRHGGLGEEDRKLADDFAEALGFIKSSIAKMDRLIGAILRLTREGRREFHPEQIDLHELIETLRDTVAHQAQEAEATIAVGALPHVFSDRLALEQIFGNLIDNGLKYLRPGVPGRIEIRGRKKLGFAIIEIEDNGRGIDPKDHQRIFDLFRRAGEQDRPGQGIGLAHVRALVRRMGGSISVDSAVDRGSTFTVTLPLNLVVTEKEKEGARP